MAKHGTHGHGHHDFDGDPEHAVPQYTTPQGTQADGVVHGHEDRDTNLAAIGKWFVGLSIGTVLTIIALAGVYRLWDGMMKQAEAVPPAMSRSQVPPEPRLIPNPIDDSVGGLDPIKTPIDRNAEYQARMDEEMVKLKLQDEQTGLPTIPAEVAQEVIQKSQSQGAVPNRPPNAPRVDGVEFSVPSESSGGTAVENHLH